MSTAYRSSTGYRQSIPYEGANAQFARPSADNSVGTWVTAPLFSKINEVSFNDSGLISSALNPVSVSSCKIKLSSVADPLVSTGHIVRYRYAKDTAAGQTINFTVKLYQGNTLIASNTHSNVASGLTAGTFTLSGGEADSITDYTDLYIQFEAQGS